jgi:hypothetical protein
VADDRAARAPGAVGLLVDEGPGASGLGGGEAGRVEHDAGRVLDESGFAAAASIVEDDLADLA